jgi:hypothetical protein
MINYNVNNMLNVVEKNTGLMNVMMTQLGSMDYKIDSLDKKISSSGSSGSSGSGGLISGIVDGLISGLTTEGLLGTASTALGAAGELAAGTLLPIAMIAVGGYGAHELSEQAKEEFGQDFREKLQPIHKRAMKEGLTDIAPQNAELQELLDRPDKAQFAKELLSGEIGSPKDVQRYGKENLEKIARGEDLTVKQMRTGGPQESAAVTKARTEIDAARVRPPKPTSDASKITGGGVGGAVGGTDDDVSGIKPSKNVDGNTKQKFDTIAKQAAGFGDSMGGIITAAQWALESGWGNSTIANTLNNEFGQTATASEPGKTFPGNSLKFKAYQTREDGRKEHVQHWASKYANAKTPAEAIQMLIKAGYNSEPGYLKNLSSVIASMGIDVNSPVEKGASQAGTAAATPTAGPDTATPETTPLKAPPAPMGATSGAIPIPAAAAATQAAAGPATTAPDPGTYGVSSPPAGVANQAALSSLPNVKIASGVNVDKLDPEFANKLAAAIQEYGQPVAINSGFRDDKYQAELWVRSHILRDPTVIGAAPPKQAQKVTINGRTYDVPGGGGGSLHSQGKAIDLSPAQAQDMSRKGILRKHGLAAPFSWDPVHVQLAGAGGGGDAGAQPTGAPAAGSMNISGAGGVAPGTSSISNLAASPRGFMGAPGSPAMMAQGPLGMGLPNPIGGLRSQLGAGPLGPLMSMVGSMGNIGNLIGGLTRAIGGSAQQNRGYRDAPNPNFVPDNYSRNQVPTAMPSSNLLRELFDLNVGAGMNPAGYAFGR